tara:strand:+ start:120 stop:518 length:399 start_codon:yes stop_codon:yes gene_type:complete
MANSANKSLLLKTFNEQLKELLKDMITIFPDDKEIKKCNHYLYLLIKSNPVKIISIWKNRVVPYNNIIEKGEVNFFLTKDYENDIAMDSKDTVLSAINRLRIPMQQLDEDNKDKTMRYIQNLTKLTILYYNC